MTPEQFVSRFGAPCFYHFTDIRNLDSVRALGLLRYAELRRRAIEVPAAGGNDWSHEADARLGLDEYVHLCLFSEHPMEYCAKKEGRIVQSMFLVISPEIIWHEGIRFTGDVANKTGTQLLTLTEAAERLDFLVIYDRTDWCDPEIKARRKVAKRYELLVPSDIPTDIILGL